MSEQQPAGREVAVLGGGCFWCLEAVFEQMRGVERVTSGYCGGHTPDPTYGDICGGDTGHAEVVRVEFDPAVVSFREILAVFFSIHDPTTLNRQGNDVGTQYRSVIFCQTPEQQAEAERLIRDFTAEKLWDFPIVTQVVPAETFYPAEGYHQEYFRHNPAQAYCQFVVAPKVSKFRKQFADKMKK